MLKNLILIARAVISSASMSLTQSSPNHLSGDIQSKEVDPIGNLRLIVGGSGEQPELDTAGGRK